MDNNIKKVSVIMPAFNAEQYIDSAIKSVISQEYVHWELIIIDDGSTDNTAQIANYYSSIDERIYYFYQENGKQGKARNYGISKSSGEYLAFLDADDIWLTNKLIIQIQEIQENNANLVFSDSYVFKNDEIFDVKEKMNVPGGLFYDIKSLGFFLQRNRIPILSVLVEIEKVREVGGFSEKPEIQNVEDYHLWLKLLMNNCVFYSSTYVLTKYRIHNNSITSSDKIALNKIPDAFFDLLKLYPNYKKQIEKELKLKFNKIYKKNLFTQQELAIWIEKNSKYISKSSLQYIYLFFNSFLPTKATKRLLIYTLNI
ncbi:glycosyltransferase involved in cell wall biosynthesis [Flavobacterium nitrogenifigens]|uniref:Glycosyltransferase involved in cell wall biosynthesis n=2 Tax=Flavobacterium TaxID=237 RepID=A0A7W7N9P1_9FLAO|nr:MULTISPECIES: glycosyltransferase family 2 protein [Flavobacterium]MBB4803657.1 glycosyltransferase involved in cell wall biosynthesis [Flavobacterium nitrogenifigens]MBB6388538.1 glycosyltransferase involved in cell wall biosynthesis [Flavobacterium notoginsengisoli]